MEMKVKTTKKEFDTVKTFREIKENISNEIWGLSYEELIVYLEHSRRKLGKIHMAYSM